MARPGLWRRQSGQLTLSGVADHESVVLGVPNFNDGWTLVRIIGSITYVLVPNEFTGRSQIWSGIIVSNDDTDNPQNPMQIQGPNWSWWHFHAQGPFFYTGPNAGDHRFGESFHYETFDVRGARIIEATTLGERIRFHATHGSTPDPPVAVQVYWGFSYYLLSPP